MKIKLKRTEEIFDNLITGEMFIIHNDITSLYIKVPEKGLVNTIVLENNIVGTMYFLKDTIVQPVTITEMYIEHE